MSTTTMPASTAATPACEPDRGALPDFADLVCSDIELLRAEFDALIAASWDEPPPRWPPSPPRRPAPQPGWGAGRSQAEEVVVRAFVAPLSARARQRSPP